MTLNDLALVVTMLVALSGVYFGWDARRTARERFAAVRKDNTEGDSSAAKAVELLLGPLNKRIDDQAKEITAAQINIATLRVQVGERDEKIIAMQNELDEYRGGFTILLSQMREAKIEPRWPGPRPKPGTGPLKG